MVGMTGLSMKTIEADTAAAPVSRLTLGSKLDLHNGRPTGFDYLRIGLSVAVVCAHSFVTSYGDAIGEMVWHLPYRPVAGLLLPMFFALSGFLVSGSLFRTASMVQFLGFRVIRIYPALCVEVLISALLIGPLLTTLPLKEYFTSPLLYWYLLNMTGDIQYLLPGLFHDNPSPNIVNMQLWTVPYEIVAYLGLATLTFVGIKKYHWIAPVTAVLMTLVYFAARLFVKKQWSLVAIAGGLPGELLLVCFMCGISLYLYKDKLPWSPLLCAASGVASAVLVGFVPFGDYFMAPFVAYFTISVGLNNPRKAYLLRGADYSYGIYLYGFVLQQALAAAWPGGREWWINILICVPASALVAAASWHFIEKPALGLRHLFMPKKKAKFEEPALAGQPSARASTP